MSLINNNVKKVSDNVELDFPARMSDGRMFTDYRQNCALNNSIAKNMGSWEYRDFLMNNASQIHSGFMSELEAKARCTKCNDNTVLPVKTILNCSTDSCTYQMNDPNGLGQARLY